MHLHKPFDNPAVRRALALAMNQADYMKALVGEDPELWGYAGFFTPGRRWRLKLGWTS